jgi:hypothetical protein
MINIKTSDKRTYYGRISIFRMIYVFILPLILLTYCKNDNKNINELLAGNDKPIKNIISDRIEIKYSTSFRIPHNHIIFTLYKTLDDNESYKMDIKTFAGTYEEPNWNTNDEYTRKYIESEGYKNMIIQLKNDIEGYSKENISKTIDIDKYFFEKINNDIWEINLQKIYQENYSPIMWVDGSLIRRGGEDGSEVTIEYGTFQYYMSITVWNPKNTGGEADKVNDIILEIFRRADMESLYE